RDDWHDRGVAYGMLGQPGKAAADFSKAIDLDPKCVPAWFHRGNAYRDLGQPDKAVADFSKAIGLDSKYVIAWYYRGKAYAELGQWDKAIADQPQAMHLKPDLAWPCGSLAWLLATCPDANLRDPGRAVELAKKAVGLAAKDGSNWATLGTAHYRAG